MNRIGILGYGEIGKSVGKLYDNSPFMKDLDCVDPGYDEGHLDVLNICIPWSENFINIISQEIESTEPKIVIIHSTVAPGTTKILSNKYSKSAIVHSPVRGMHPDLTESIRTFVKYIGSETYDVGLLAEKHLKSLNIKTKLVQPSIVTELGKLLSTSYYGICIAWHQEMKNMCNKFGIDFEMMKEFNVTYNDGYRKMGRGNVVRPTLDAPEGSIGGHCIVPNAEILSKIFDSCMLKSILKCGQNKEVI